MCVLPVFLTGGLSVQITADLGFDSVGLGLAVAGFFGLSALASVPCGRLVERYGSGMTSRIAVIGAACTMTGVAVFAHSYALLLFFLLCSAPMNVLGQLSSNLTLARYVPPTRLALSFGLKQSAIPIATLLAGVAVPTIALTVGWRWAYVIGAVFALGALLVTPREDIGRTPTPAKSGERALGALSVIAIAAGLGAAATSALGIFLVASAVDRGIGEGIAGLTLTMGSVVGLTLRLVHGWLADRREGGHIAVVAASMLLGAGGLALLALPGTPALVIGTILAFGLGWAWPGLLQFAVVRVNPSAPAAATSILQVGVYTGGGAGPVAYGFLVDQLGFSASWLIGAATMVLAAVMMGIGRQMLTAHGVARAAAATA